MFTHLECDCLFCDNVYLEMDSVTAEISISGPISKIFLFGIPVAISKQEELMYDWTRVRLSLKSTDNPNKAIYYVYIRLQRSSDGISNISNKCR